MKRRILFLLSAVLWCGSLTAQNSRTVDVLDAKIYFRQGQSTIDPSFRGNGPRLDSLVWRLSEIQNNPRSRVESVQIISSASPEGGATLNRQLSERRATEQIAPLLRRATQLPDSLIRIESRSENWEGLTTLVEGSEMPYRDEVLHILHNTPEWIFNKGVVVDGRKRQLMRLRGGRAWRYLDTHFFPELRSSEIRILSNTSRCETEACVPMQDPETIIRHDTVVVTMRDTVFLPASCPPFYMSLKSNLLYDAALVPNIGVEFYAGRGWSVGASWMYGWWHSNTHHRYWRTYGGEIGVRKYFGRRAQVKPLTGHHLGLYGQMLTYDFELGGTGYLSKLSYGAGIEYGYSLPVGRRLNLDFSIGVGYLGGEYKVYEPIDTHYVWQQTRQRHWIGPTKAEISLVWLLGRGNYNEKGGKR